jgi:hypothetical protein
MLLKQRFGWGLVEMVEQAANITPFRKKAQEMPTQIIRQMKKMNQYDSRLYQYAYKRFCKAVVDAGQPLIADVIAFRKISQLCMKDNHGDISKRIARIIKTSQKEAKQYSDSLAFLKSNELDCNDCKYN